MTDVSLIFEDADAAGPGTHVILIGVSAYDHLLGGPQPRPHLADGMAQLVSPGRSARAVADWFLSDFQNGERPLRSLSLLVSDDHPAPYVHGRANCLPAHPPQPTINNVTDAVDAWLSRSLTNEENMTVFFFAGHGISTSDPLLFLQDFGKRENDRYASAINLTDMLEGMRTQVPGRQLFLIDACRTIERTSVEQAGIHKGVALVSPQNLVGTGRSLALQSVHHAATEFAPAYGTLDGISLFTDALLRAFRGGGGQSQSGWRVGTGGLEQALGAYVARSAKDYAVSQVPERSRGQHFVINQPTAIEVPLYISLDKMEAWSDMRRLEANCGTGLSASWSHDPAFPVQEWSCIVPLREHTVAATFRPGATYSHSPETVVIGTPETVWELTIDPGAGP